MISFIIPTKNEEAVIEKLLRILKTYSGEAEIIVSDGGSRDKTIEIAHRYTDKVALHDSSTRQTIGGGRNAGAKMASGEYLVFLDADDTIFEPDEFFSRALRYFQDPRVVALRPSIRVLPESETWADKLVTAYFDYYDALLNNVLHFGACPGEFQMIRREAFEKVNGYDERLAAGEDYDLYHRLNKLGRTKSVFDLRIYHSGRRAHKIGWPKLLATWVANGVFVTFFRRSASQEWKEIR